MDATTAALITLITVSPNGEVHWERFQTQHMCEEAANIVLWGKTIEQQEADADAAKKADEEYRATWRKDHPCYAPKTKAEKDMVKSGINGVAGDHVSAGAWYWDEVQDGKICSMPMTTSSATAWSVGTLTKAVCVP